MGFSREEYWSGLSFFFPEDLPDPGIKPGSPALQADSLPFELQERPHKYSAAHQLKKQKMNYHSMEDFPHSDLLQQNQHQEKIPWFKQ